jgi:hypothetical protein
VAKVFVKWVDPNGALLVRWCPTERAITEFRPRLSRLVIGGVELAVPEVSTVTAARVPADGHDVHRVLLAGYFDVDDETARRLGGRSDLPAEYEVRFVEKATGATPLSEGLDYEELERPPLSAGLIGWRSVSSAEAS